MLFNFEGAAFRKWWCSSAGRAPALHAGGQEFDPPHLHHWKWAHSSGGQSARLISVRSVVRVHLSPPFSAASHFFACRVYRYAWLAKKMQISTKIHFVYFTFFCSLRIDIRVARKENANQNKIKITDESLLEKRMQFDTKVKNNIPPQKANRIRRKRQETMTIPSLLFTKYLRRTLKTEQSI